MVNRSQKCKINLTSDVDREAIMTEPAKPV
jgi:hypothetical protein